MHGCNPRHKNLWPPRHTSSFIHRFHDIDVLHSEMGGRSPKMNHMISYLFRACQEANITLNPHYIPSAANPADLPSRSVPFPIMEASLHPRIMSTIQSWLNTRKNFPIWDWMATEANTQCERWVSPQEDWFTKDLVQISPGWIYPPFYLIPHILNRWRNFPPQAQAAMILPWYPAAPWWVFS